MRGLTLDSGALIAFEREDRKMIALVRRAKERKGSLAVPVGVVAQVWRDGRKQARLARLLGSSLVEIALLDDAGARRAGQLCGATCTRDVVDATVVLVAQQRGDVVVTSDPDDIKRLDPSMDVAVV